MFGNNNNNNIVNNNQMQHPNPFQNINMIQQQVSKQNSNRIINLPMQMLPPPLININKSNFQNVHQQNEDENGVSITPYRNFPNLHENVLNLMEN